MDQPPESLEIVDCHAHVASDRIIPQSFVEGAVRNVAEMLNATGLSLPFDELVGSYLAQLQDHDCDQLIREMDAASVTTTVLLAADFSYALRDCRLSAEESLLLHRDVMRRHPGRFEAFAGVDPRWGTDGLRLFERAVSDWGFAGFKIYPPCGLGPSHPAFAPYYAICHELALPITIHIGPTSSSLRFDLAHPLEIDAAALRYGRAKFILAHASIHYREECAMLCECRPNVYLDISGFESHRNTGRADEELRDLFGRGLNHKVMFGSDWPVFRGQGSQLDFVSELLADDAPIGELPDAQIELVMSSNIRRLLNGRRANRGAELASLSGARASA